MRIGIITPVFLFKDFVSFFDKEDREYLQALEQNENGPAPSIITQGFLKEGHFVRVFTLGTENRICKSNQIDVVTINLMSGFRKYVRLNEFKNAYYLSKEIKSHLGDLDVLHAHWSYYTAMAAGRFVNKLPVFCTVRDWTSVIRSFLPNNGGMQWRIRQYINDRNLKNKGIHFIGNSPYTKALIEERIGVEVPCIMNPINDSYLRKDAKIYPPHLSIVCIASSVDARKNIGNLLLAFKEIIKVLPTAKLTCIFGYANHLDNNAFYREWKANGLLDGVTVLKGLSHDEVFKYIDEATMMVNPSLEETFGNTIIESMARKTVVVAGKESGAIPYLIDNNKRGYLCDVNSVDDISRTILYAYRHADETEEKTKEAFRWLENNNTLEAITRLHIKYYNQFLCK